MGSAARGRTRAHNIRITCANCPLFGPFLHHMLYVFTLFLKKCFLPSVGITFLQINPVHFDAKALLSVPQGGGKNTDVCDLFAPSA